MILTVCPNPSVDSFWSFDRINKGTTSRSSGESFFPGGKGIHVAFALKELGADVTMLGIWGGKTGKWIKSKCREQNILTTGLSVDDWTRICITNRSDTSWNRTELLGAGPKLTPHQADKFILMYQKQVKSHDYEAIIISGSVPGGFDNDTYKQLVSIGQRLSVPVFIDATDKLLESALEANPYAVHINIQEAKEVCHQDNPVHIARWLNKYCSLAAVTAGEDGLFLGSDKRFYHAKCKLNPSDIVSTVGAGDCLLAGLCFSTLNHDAPVKWAKYATACGTANCINQELGMLQKEDVNKLLTQINIKSINSDD